MSTIALYSPKGGVGKTTLAVNLAWCAAVRSCRRTLLWELDGQGGATFLLNGVPDQRQRAQSVFARTTQAETLIRETTVPLLDLLPADPSLHALDGFLRGLEKRRRLAKLIASFDSEYDHVFLDCPPVLNAVSEQVFRAADVIIVPLSPSPLAWRALDELIGHLIRTYRKHPPILPVFSMVDRKRALHRAALDSQPAWPVIPMSSLMEQVAVRRQALPQFAARSAAAKALGDLWEGIERRLGEFAMQLPD